MGDYPVLIHWVILLGINTKIKHYHPSYGICSYPVTISQKLFLIPCNTLSLYYFENTQELHCNSITLQHCTVKFNSNNNFYLVDNSKQESTSTGSSRVVSVLLIRTGSYYPSLLFIYLSRCNRKREILFFIIKKAILMVIFSMNNSFGHNHEWTILRKVLSTCRRGPHLCPCSPSIPQSILVERTTGVSGPSYLLSMSTSLYIFLRIYTIIQYNFHKYAYISNCFWNNNWLKNCIGKLRCRLEFSNHRIHSSGVIYVEATLRRLTPFLHSQENFSCPFCCSLSVWRAF